MLKSWSIKSEFAKNVITLISGTAIAQALSLIFSPIISRIYNPEDFGFFAIFMSVVSGIAEHFAPENIIGQQVSLLLNLEPRKIKGIESQGMILMAEDSDGKLKFVQPNEMVNPGAEVR